jgi:hypothetical protein
VEVVLVLVYHQILLLLFQMLVQIQTLELNQMMKLLRKLLGQLLELVVLEVVCKVC